ncbi:MAG: TonB-dependent receptor [bacterium]
MNYKQIITSILIFVISITINTLGQNSLPVGLSDYSKSESNAAERGGIIGKVTDEEGEPLPGTNIIILENKYGASSRLDGSYEIGNLLSGTYSVKFSFVGYKTIIKKVTIVDGKKTELNVKLESESFEIGGIKVVGTSELIPTEINTRTTITSSEIEHFQATNLKDVLNLVPGIQKSDNQGLNKTSQVTIRGDEADALSAFGTLILVDGARESNNSNMQFEGLAGAKFGGSTNGRGVDLRQIPADNIESIEVISGLPSVRYGDFTSGIIDIKTKIGASPHRFKFKNNPTTNEGNLGGGFGLNKENSLSYNVNIARSERDVRLEGDEYTRYSGQIVYTNKSYEGKLISNYKFSTQVINDEEEPKNDFSQTKNYNRGFSLGFNTWGTYKSEDNVSALDYSAYVKMNKISLRKSKLVQSDLRVLPNGDTVSIYTGVLQNKGQEWNAGGRFEYQDVYFTGSYINKYLIGTEIEYDANTGEGIIIDTLFNYYGADSPRRPRTFDEMPGQTLISLYAENKMTGKLFFDFSLMFGFRYEMYRPKNINLKGLWGDGDLVESHQGSFFNPRVNLMVYLGQNRQLRMSAGRTSKSPPMSTVYPQDDILQWRDPVSNKVNYFVFNLTVPELKGYKETQYELSYDEKLFNKIGLTISAYYKERSGQPTGVVSPFFYVDDSASDLKIYYLDVVSMSQNVGKYFSKGFEATLKTSKIDALNMTFKITGSYNYTKTPGGNTVYDQYPNAAWGQSPNYKVPGLTIDTLIGWTYNSSGSWRDEIVLNYFLKYTHPTLGLWVTLRAEQVLSERRKNFNLEPVNYSYLTPAELATRLFNESTKTRPSKWLFTFNVSKSLFKGAEVSFYVNNFLDDPAINTYQSSPTTYMDEKRNPDLFYGLEFSMIIDNLFK